MARKEKIRNCRLGRVGGQAVIEGVMMKSGDNMAIASRMPDGSILVQKKRFTSARQKHKILNLPIIRGVVNFVEMMKLSYTTMDASTAALGLEDEEPSKFEKWLSEKLHVDIMTVVMVIGIILGLGLAVALFIILPTASGNGISKLVELITDGKFVLANHQILRAVVEGVFKVAIFLLYLWLVSLMKDIRRVFEYHGAEHKAVFCYEAGLELTPENVAKFKRFHPRCGTSFMFFMILIGIIVGCFITVNNTILRSLIKLALLPITVGVGYEIIRFAGSHDNFLIRAISAPGLWVQRITTKEPDVSQMECAIAALKSAIPDEFPGYSAEKQFGPWKKTSPAAAASGDAKVAAARLRAEKRREAPHRRAVMSRMTAAEKVRYRRKNDV